MFRIILGIVPPVIVLGIVFFSWSSGNLKMFMNGELKKKHAPFEQRCEVCHEPWYGVYNQMCSKCHYDECEYYMELTEEDEDLAYRTYCYDCHMQHRGRSYDKKLKLKPG